VDEWQHCGAGEVVGAQACCRAGHTQCRSMFQLPQMHQEGETGGGLHVGGHRWQVLGGIQQAAIKHISLQQQVTTCWTFHNPPTLGVSTRLAGGHPHRHRHPPAASTTCAPPGPSQDSTTTAAGGRATTPPGSWAPGSADTNRDCSQRRSTTWGGQRKGEGRRRGIRGKRGRRRGNNRCRMYAHVCS
jgi:hypothetical protein